MINILIVLVLSFSFVGKLSAENYVGSSESEIKKKFEVRDEYYYFYKNKNYKLTSVIHKSELLIFFLKGAGMDDYKVIDYLSTSYAKIVTVGNCSSEDYELNEYIVAAIEEYPLSSEYYRPEKAWLADPEIMRFLEVDSGSIICSNESY